MFDQSICLLPRLGVNANNHIQNDIYITLVDSIPNNSSNEWLYDVYTSPTSSTINNNNNNDQDYLNESNYLNRPSHSDSTKDQYRIRRLKANKRERGRMHDLNNALEELKKSIPDFGHTFKLSKIDTLKLATNYIRLLTVLLRVNVNPSSEYIIQELCQGLSSGLTNRILTLCTNDISNVIKILSDRDMQEQNVFIENYCSKSFAVVDDDDENWKLNYYINCNEESYEKTEEKNRLLNNEMSYESTSLQTNIKETKFLKHTLALKRNISHVADVNEYSLVEPLSYNIPTKQLRRQS